MKESNEKNNVDVPRLSFNLCTVHVSFPSLQKHWGGGCPVADLHVGEGPALPRIRLKGEMAEGRKAGRTCFSITL